MHWSRETGYRTMFDVQRSTFNLTWHWFHSSVIYRELRYDLTYIEVCLGETNYSLVKVSTISSISITVSHYWMSISFQFHSIDYHLNTYLDAQENHGTKMILQARLLIKSDTKIVRLQRVGCHRTCSCVLMTKSQVDVSLSIKCPFQPSLRCFLGSCFGRRKHHPITVIVTIEVTGLGVLNDSSPGRPAELNNYKGTPNAVLDHSDTYSVLFPVHK